MDRKDKIVSCSADILLRLRQTRDAVVTEDKNKKPTKKDRSRRSQQGIRDCAEKIRDTLFSLFDDTLHYCKIHTKWIVFLGLDLIAWHVVGALLGTEMWTDDFFRFLTLCCLSCWVIEVVQFHNPFR